MVCVSVWVSRTLIGDDDTYGKAIDDQDVAKNYWNVGFTPRFRVLPEDNEANTYRAEDIVTADEIETPRGEKLRALFLSSKTDQPCYDDRMTERDSLRTLHVFYLNIDYIDSEVIGRGYLYQEHAFIVMTTNANYNTFPHEFGHTLYFTNNRLDGNDPISHKEHNEDPDNLMYHTMGDETKILEPEQLDAKEYSYLTNPHVIHDHPIMKNFSSN
ncbi:hypothetical protein [Bacillus toyonensis]|uniref:hypothetical protein n=1 Tax=Bacillus toyonensis TaxID=155322 RepID=UPI000BEC1A96|nr:hypothetical protein [Bacillus toyonensis]PDY85984.1 hypothetical protein CON67_26350 [Bacillus toyonensis]